MISRIHLAFVQLIFGKYAFFINGFREEAEEKHQKVISLRLTKVLEMHANAVSV